MIRILIVEDYPFLSLDLSNELVNRGFLVVGIAASVAAALEFLADCECDIAVLDVDLGKETAAPVARELSIRQIPFIVATGYSLEQCSPEFQTGSIVGKPIRIGYLVSELRKCSASRVSPENG